MVGYRLIRLDLRTAGSRLTSRRITGSRDRAARPAEGHARMLTVSGLGRDRRFAGAAKSGGANIGGTSAD